MPHHDPPDYISCKPPAPVPVIPNSSYTRNHHERLSPCLLKPDPASVATSRSNSLMPQSSAFSAIASTAARSPAATTPTTVLLMTSNSSLSLVRSDLLHVQAFLLDYWCTRRTGMRSRAILNSFWSTTSFLKPLVAHPLGTTPPLLIATYVLHPSNCFDE